MTSSCYLLDANVLSRLSADQRMCGFVRKHCRIPTEVLHEVAGFADVAQLGALEYPMSAELLDSLGEVMKTIPPGDFKLVDLYTNKGNADPILIATALTAMRESLTTLFPEDWKIVSDDAAVRAKAEEHGVACLDTADFLPLLSAS